MLYARRTGTLRAGPFALMLLWLAFWPGIAAA